ncbi:MAG: NADPH:quinone oxidoreductase family protein [Thermoleophilaceae bacterium]|nr:NADPH:quinone oxidoreductase family protein [Thermoleophilaceae bacterium]
MRALQVTELTGPEAVTVTSEAPEPEVGDGVLIEVEAGGLAFPDLLLTRGKYQVKPDLPFTLGTEVAGTVAAAAEESGFAPGERVMAITFGGLAERAVAEPHMTFRLPRSFSMEQGAGFILNYHTSHFALHRRGALKEGETVLVHGAAGGVGTAAIQIARGSRARTIGVVSNDEKERVAREMGADEVVRGDGDWLAAVRELTGGRGVDVLYDPVGGERFADSVRALAPEGRLLVVGFAGGQIPTVTANRLLLRNVSVVGVGWGEFAWDRPELMAEIGADLERLAQEGHVRPLVGRSYPLEEGARALRDLDERRATGKLVLTLR